MHDLLKALPLNSIGEMLFNAGSNFLEHSDSRSETVGHQALPMGQQNGISAAVKHSNDLAIGTVGVAVHLGYFRGDLLPAELSAALSITAEQLGMKVGMLAASLFL